MRKISLWVIVILIVFVFPRFCIQKVRLNEVGARSSQLGAGVEPRDFQPGFYLVIPGIHRMDILDPTLQFLHMTPEKDTAPPLQIIGKEQYSTTVDTTIPFRIKKGEAHKVVVEIGPTMDRVRERVRTAAQKVLWEVLGELGVKDFYDPTLRFAKAQESLLKLNAELEGSHIIVEDILIRSVVYDTRFEQLLLTKQLLDQERELNTVLEEKERALSKTQSIDKDAKAAVLKLNEEKTAGIRTIQAETDKALDRIGAEANLQAQTNIAEAERYKRENIAEGELLKTTAQAEGDKAVNKAYEGAGGDLYIVRQMIDNIRFGEIEINTNQTNPFDVNQMLRMLGVPASALEGRP